MLSRLFVLLAARSSGEFLHAVRVSTTLGVPVELSMNPRQQPSTYQRLVLVPVREQPRHPLRELVDVPRHLIDIYSPADPLGELTHQRLLSREMAIHRGHGDAGPLGRSGKRELLYPVF